jgi:hypothetical protein
LSHLKEFLLAHLTQLEDNEVLQGQGSAREKSHRLLDVYGTLHGWLNKISGPHAGAGPALAFLLCAIGSESGAECFNSPKANYMIDDLTRRLSILSRVYNDFGSVQRDQDEGNVNCLDFSEFHNDDKDPAPCPDASAAHQLLDIARYEKACVDRLINEDLAGVVSEDMLGKLRVFCNAVEIYGQLYVLKDHTPRMDERQ